MIRLHTLSERIARHLERRGLLVRDLEGGYLALDPGDQETLDELRGHSTPYRIALGPHAGRKALTLQILPSSGDDERPAARATGFSLHAGVVAAGDERAKTAQGLIHYRLKTPYRNGTTHVVFEPLDKIAWNDFEPPQADPKGWRAGRPEYFIARLAALVPNPRVNLTRYHGAINNNWRPPPSSARASDPGPSRSASSGER